MLKLVQDTRQPKPKTEIPGASEDHASLFSGYFQSHRIRNHSAKTIAKEEAFLKGWFESHGFNSRPLYTWEAMAPVTGRERVVAYGNALLEAGLNSHTIRSYLGILSRYFSYVLEHPFILRGIATERIQDKYGAIDQPISEFDMPHHVYDGERLGIPLDPERLYDFYALIRQKYLARNGCKVTTGRNYAMAVLAGESGLRIDEIVHLEIEDLFFESRKIQTRFAKAALGSGKRSRTTLFTPLCRDTIRFYLNEYRNKIKTDKKYVFPSKSAKLMSYPSLHQALREMVECAQKEKFPILSHMSWHWFRRVFATRFIERFPNQLAVLLDLLGHMSPNTVHRYIRHSSAWMDKQMQEVLEGVIKWPSIGD